MNAPRDPFIPFETDRVFIGGEWQPGASGETLALEDPSDGSELARIARGGAADINAAVGAARAALEGGGANAWGRMAALERGRVLSAIARKVLENVELLARLEVHDVGKPLKQARADAVALARYFEFYGGAADKVHGQTLPFASGYTALTLREPHGVTGHIVPWNYPMQIVGRSVGAALAMGNACVLKPAEEACLTVLAFARIAAEAGLPPGALNLVPGLGEEAGAALAAHPDVNHISFTGSVATGALVQIAAARNAVPVRSSSAARARRSSSPTPTSTPRCPSSSTPESRTPARRARRRRASSSSGRCSRPCARRWPSATGRFAPGRQRATSTSAR